MGPLAVLGGPASLSRLDQPGQDLIRRYHNHFGTKLQNLRDQFVDVLAGHESKNPVQLPVPPDDVESALADRASGT